MRKCDRVAREKAENRVFESRSNIGLHLPRVLCKTTKDERDEISSTESKKMTGESKFVEERVKRESNFTANY